jgi:hypothetical protein
MPAYDAAELDRLWSHGLHEDNMYIQRGNFFLVAESLLLVAYAGVLSTHARQEVYILTASRVIAVFSLALTLMWILISQRHMTYLRLIRERMLTHLREYRDTRMSWQASRARLWRRAHTNLVLTYAVPGLAAVMWLLLLFLI